MQGPRRILVGFAASTIIVAPFLALAPLSAVQAATAMPVLPTAADERSALQKQLDDVNRQIAGYQGQLTSLAGKKKTLASTIGQLQAEQAKLTLSAQATGIMTAQVLTEIDDTQAAIDANDAKIAVLRTKMRGLLREMAKQRGHTPFEAMLTSTSISEFFQKLFYLKTLAADLGSSVTEVQAANADLAAHQRALSEEKERQLHLAAILTLQNGDILRNIEAQNALLAKTRGQEANYQASIKSSTAKAKEIRNRIYSLLQVGRQVTFEEAVQVAQWASDASGVRAAFLLAILTQESNLGKNVGTCNRAGDPPSKGWKVIMKPDRDQKPFVAVTADLGRDPNVTPVSCPMRDKAGNQVGWGGAMGPAQFIPSTWIGFQKRVASVTGKTADPWDIRDAFMAAALLLKDNGAGTQTGEWAAAMRYFSGSTNPAFRFYGDSVAATAAGYQDDIDELRK